VTYITRKLSIVSALKKKSIMLLGPRRTGKSSLIRHELPGAKVYNLLKVDEFQRLAMRPQAIREALASERQELVIIDEIQKLPSLMDEVHLLIEEHGQRFLLTGSSARKLRRAHTSLMAGRAKTLHLHPFVSAEIGDFSLARVLQYGLLPPVWLTDDPADELASYAGDYLQEEIRAEALSRNIENFSRFLQRAAHCNAQQINFESVASDAQVPARTVREYFHLLEDTLIGTMLQPLQTKGRLKAVAKGKFYFFDNGVVHQLQGLTALSEHSAAFGEAFETFLFHELKAYMDYRGGSGTLNFWRTQLGAEVDFVINGDIAVEVKATVMVDERDLKGMKALAGERSLRRQFIVSRDPERRRIGDIEVWPYLQFLRALWAGDLW